jgi:hypothetical protein
VSHARTRLADIRPRTFRDALRCLALNAMTIGQQQAPLPDCPRIQFLLLHHVFDDEIAAFQRLLARLAQYFQYIDYSEAIDRILTNRIDRAYLAVSFDDGLKCGRRAADELARVGARACFFVCPPLLDQPNSALAGEFCRRRLQHAPVEFLDWDDAAALVDQGHEFGAHTMSHPNLATLSATQAEDEIKTSREALARRLGAVRHFAWPYGQLEHIRREVVQAVFDAGFQSCASGVRGCHGPVGAARHVSSTQLCVRRDSIIAGWPLSHILHFMRRSAACPLPLDQTWPARLAPAVYHHAGVAFKSFVDNPCASPSMPFLSHRAAG